VAIDLASLKAGPARRSLGARARRPLLLVRLAAAAAAAPYDANARRVEPFGRRSV